MHHGNRVTIGKLYSEYQYFFQKLNKGPQKRYKVGK